MSLASDLLRWEGLAYNLARRYWRPGAPLQLADLLQEARVAIMEGFRKFDASRGVLSTYLYFCITKRLRRACDKMQFVCSYGRKHGWNEPEMVSLDTVDEWRAGGEDPFMGCEDRLDLLEAWKKLPHFERELLYLRFAKECSLLEIASMFHLSKQRVSQIVRAAIQTMREEALDD